MKITKQQLKDIAEKVRAPLIFGALRLNRNTKKLFNTGIMLLCDPTISIQTAEKNI